MTMKLEANTGKQPLLRDDVPNPKLLHSSPSSTPLTKPIRPDPPVPRVQRIGTHTRNSHSIFHHPIPSSLLISGDFPKSLLPPPK